MQARLFKFLLILHVTALNFALNCRETLENHEITFIDWSNLKTCLAEVNSETLTKNTSENIWRLLKSTFNGIENIPVETFMHLGYTLTAIPSEELRNLSMERVEIVEAFGAIRGTDKLQGFSTEQSSLIAQKVQDEWLGKNSDTYSEYDLVSMGEILCHINVTIIDNLHADALKSAIEWIGNIKNCPQDRLEALAKLAKHNDAFGEPSTWSKLVVSIMGNVLNGLPETDLAAIDEDKLHLNRYYTEKHKSDKNIKNNNKSFKNKNNTITLKNSTE